MKKMLLILALVVVVCACTDPEVATKTLRVNGYSDIRITEWDMFACSKDDFYCTGFEATAPNGERVSGAVGSGMFFKGATIRLH